MKFGKPRTPDGRCGLRAEENGNFLASSRTCLSLVWLRSEVCLPVSESQLQGPARAETQVENANLRATSGAMGERLILRRRGPGGGGAGVRHHERPHREQVIFGAAKRSSGERKLVRPNMGREFGWEKLVERSCLRCWRRRRVQNVFLTTTTTTLALWLTLLSVEPSQQFQGPNQLFFSTLPKSPTSLSQHSASQEFDSQQVPRRKQVSQQASVWRSQSNLGLPTSGGGGEARGVLLTRALSSAAASSSSLRGARNTSATSGPGQNSWHFPRITGEHAAEVLLTGAQVINRIAQAETPLNYCRTPDDQEGECSDIRKCIWLVLDKARLKQSVCLRNLIIPAVCCPLSNATNTALANMIQSTLEPVLFRPKAKKQQQQQQAFGSSPMRPFASIINKTIVGMPPPSPISMIVR